MAHVFFFNYINFSQKNVTNCEPSIILGSLRPDQKKGMVSRLIPNRPLCSDGTLLPGQPSAVPMDTIGTEARGWHREGLQHW